MLNKVIVIGRLTKDTELRQTNSGTAVVAFSIACDRDRKDANGTYQTDFFDITAWGKTAEFVNQWFSKGSKIIVVGRLQTRHWEDKNGNKRISTEIVAEEVQFGESKRERADSENTVSDFEEIDDDGDCPF